MAENPELDTNEIDGASISLRHLYRMRAALKDSCRVPITVGIGEHCIALYQRDTVIRAAALVECEQQIVETEERLRTAVGKKI